MKTAQQWSDELNGETSPQAIQQIQCDAVSEAVLLLMRNKANFGPGFEAVRDLMDALIPVSAPITELTDAKRSVQ